jgi:hypothetical protein
LPEILAVAASKTSKPFEKFLLDGLVVAFSDAARWLLPLFAAAVAVFAVWRSLPVWQGLVLAGLLQALVVSAVIAPRVISVTQGPIREAAEVAKAAGGTVVAWRIIMPSFSVYRQRQRRPDSRRGDWCDAYRSPGGGAGATGARLQMRPLYQKTIVTLARVERGAAMREPACMTGIRGSTSACSSLSCCRADPVSRSGWATPWQRGFLAGQAATSVLPRWSGIATTLGMPGPAGAGLALLPALFRCFLALFVGALLAGAISRASRLAVPLPRPAAVLDAAQMTIIGAS